MRLPRSSTSWRCPYFLTALVLSAAGVFVDLSGYVIVTGRVVVAMLLMFFIGWMIGGRRGHPHESCST